MTLGRRADGLNHLAQQLAQGAQRTGTELFFDCLAHQLTFQFVGQKHGVMVNHDNISE